jgi:spermidine/putrescine transport system permease protein
MVERRSYYWGIIQPIFVLCAYLFLYLPIIIMILFSFNHSSVSIRWDGFSLRWYKQLFCTPEILDALQASLIVALTATVLSVILGLFFVIGSRLWRSSLLLNLFYTNIMLPEIVLAIGLLSIFTFFQIPLGYMSLITGHTLIGLGFAIPIIRARFVELDPELTEASLDLGASYPQTVRKILLPLLMPSVIASALLVFTISLDDFLIAFFCSGPRVQTLSVYVYSMVRTGIDPTINAVSALFLAISSIVVLSLCFFKIIDQVIAHE